MRHQFWNLPNSITLARLGLIPLLVLSQFWTHEWQGLVSALVFAIAASTDWIDGYIARKMNLTTPFGAFLDPVADKLMVVTALVLQVEMMDAPWFTLVAAVIICREVTVSALREWMAFLGGHRKVAVQMLGKIKTVFQMCAIGFLFLHETFPVLWLYLLVLVLFFLAVIFTLWSMSVYLMAAWREMQSPVPVVVKTGTDVPDERHHG